MTDEVARRLVHATGAAVPLGYLLGGDLVSWRVVQLFLSVALVVVVALEFLRLSVGLDWAIYERLTREYEQDNPAGYALYIVGMAVVAWAVAVGLPVAVAVPAMLMLAIGDPISGLLGSTEASSVKQLWVLLVMFGVCTLLAAPFVSTAAAVLGGVAATFADGVKPTIAGYVVDDNLSIPVFGAVAMWVGLVAVPTL
ncbi:dolichol kinase [Haloarcula salinisoli]|uniref:Dolichol kinase n=1 Tax=Haloarcula salinisoli TaxID=2487746 RepID=A0A8J7YDT3_9EURY|nr:dolichol kinase [Halomicroarcula salinisoli]MBX0286744.1 dolichol kinase [Halomicroarcula salinisoli]MBX0304055.1 dolichol kinase [Halomicroarcula salinisoli]